MTIQEHKKHTDLVRPALGNFAIHEWAILGTNCNVIKKLADSLIASLSPKYKCGFVDEVHQNTGEDGNNNSRFSVGAAKEFVRYKNFAQLTSTTRDNKFYLREQLSGMDMVLVNGNHFQAHAQVLVIDVEKKASLQKRISQLTNVELIIFRDEEQELFDFVKEAIPGWRELTHCRIDESDKIITFFNSKLEQANPPINALVLAGGKSSRMGHDKAHIGWHGKEQLYFMADLLQEFCHEVYISCRPEQKNEIDSAYKLITDSFTGLGPYGAILSAFREQPMTAWLVVACDLPLLNKDEISILIQNRNASSIATCFESPHDNFPEPLITIWEPKSYPVLLNFLSQGYSCPRKVLINNDITLVKPLRPDSLMNVNTPSDLAKAKNLLNGKISSL